MKRPLNFCRATIFVLAAIVWQFVRACCRAESLEHRLDRRFGLDGAAGPRRRGTRLFRKRRVAVALHSVPGHQPDAQRIDGQRAGLRDDPAVYRRRGYPRPAGENRRATTTKTSGYAIISRPDIDSVKALKGKRIAINTFGSSADFAIYQLLSRNGLDPNKDVTLQAVAGSPDARFAALLGGSVDATVVNSPFEYRAEQKGFKTLLSVKEIAEFVRIPIVGLSTTQRKIDREPDEIVRMLRGLRAAILFLQSQQEVGVGLLEKLLKLDRPAAERFYPALSRPI